MKPRLLLRLSLLLLLLAACAPRAVPTEAPAATQAVSANPPAEPVTVTPAVSSPATQPPAAATALPIATSRGPELEATDPSTVQMASGGLQFVEFFEFW